MSEAAPRSRRLFFAIMPSSATRRALIAATREAVARARGRPVPPANLHVTVAFLGQVDPERVALAADAAPVEAGRFVLEFGRFGRARRGGLLWLEPLAVPEPLERLERALWERLAERGFAREARRYRPHVTLARKVETAVAGAVAFRWPVRKLSLVESVPGEHGHDYRPLETWPL